MIEYRRLCRMLRIWAIIFCLLFLVLSAIIYWGYHSDRSALADLLLLTLFFSIIYYCVMAARTCRQMKQNLKDHLAEYTDDIRSYLYQCLDGSHYMPWARIESLAISHESLTEMMRKCHHDLRAMRGEKLNPDIVRFMELLPKLVYKDWAGT